jgi:hypothetical protein
MRFYDKANHNKLRLRNLLEVKSQIIFSLVQISLMLYKKCE